MQNVQIWKASGQEKEGEIFLNEYLKWNLLLGNALLGIKKDIEIVCILFVFNCFFSLSFVYLNWYVYVNIRKIKLQVSLCQRKIKWYKCLLFMIENTDINLHKSQPCFAAWKLIPLNTEFSMNLKSITFVPRRRLIF